MNYKIIGKYIKELNFSIPIPKTFFLLSKDIENYKINIPSFNNIRTIYKEQESKSSFGSQWTDEAYNNIGVNPIYIEIKNHRHHYYLIVLFQLLIEGKYQ